MGQGSEDEAGPPPAVATGAFSEITPVAVGTAVWALLFVIGLFIQDDLADSGRGWWVWSAAAGAVLGVFGYWFMRRRHTRRAAFSAPPAGRVEPRTPDRS